jgi:hypothetical protein
LKPFDGNRRRSLISDPPEQPPTSTADTDPPGGNGDSQKRRLLDTHQCALFQNSKDGFNAIALDLKRRSNPDDGGKVMKESSASYHEHGVFSATEEWYNNVQGEYSLSCLHHECSLGLFFAPPGTPTDDYSDATRRRFLEEGMYGRTSLRLQGTTELAYQGPDSDMMVCVENCGAHANEPLSSVAVGVDAEVYEVVNLRGFDNVNNLVEVHGKGDTTNSAKGTKTAKGKKTLLVYTCNLLFTATAYNATCVCVCVYAFMMFHNI